MDDLMTLFEKSLSAVSDGVRFLIPSTTKMIDLHRALFISLDEKVQTELLRELSDNPAAAENILQLIYFKIDFESYSAVYDRKGFVFPLRPIISLVSHRIAEEYKSLQIRYPLFIGLDRPAFTEDDNEFLPSAETIVASVLSFLSSETVSAISDCAEGLLTNAYSLLARQKGYEDPADAERALDAAAYDAEFTDSLCGGEC